LKRLAAIRVGPPPKIFRWPQLIRERGFLAGDIFEVPIPIGPINYAEACIYKVKVRAVNEDWEIVTTVRKVTLTSTLEKPENEQMLTITTTPADNL